MIPVDELIAHLNAEAEDAEQIESLERSAVQTVQDRAGIYLGQPTEIVQSVPWTTGPIALMGEPSGAVVLEQRSADGWEAIDSSSYYVDGAFIYPVGEFRSTGRPRLRLTYTAGYTAGLEPEQAIQAVRMLVGYWWANRGDGIGMSATITEDLMGVIDSLVRDIKRTVV